MAVSSGSKGKEDTEAGPCPGYPGGALASDTCPGQSWVCAGQPRQVPWWYLV